MQHKFLFSVVVMTLLTLLPGCSSSNKHLATNDHPQIIIGKVPYHHEWISVSIIENIGEELGYSVKVQEGDIGFMFLGLAHGEIDIYPDVWLPTLHKNYLEKYKDKIKLTGTLFKNADIGWAVPSYVELDSIADMKGQAAKFNNRVIGIEPSAGIMLTSEKVIKEYNLEQYQVIEGSTPAMLAELERAIITKQPIVFMAWRPNTMFAKYDIKLLNDPKGIWKFDDVNIAVSTGLRDKAPKLYDFVTNFEISKRDIEAMMVEMEQGKTADEIAKQWIKNNRPKVYMMLGK